MAFLTLKQRVFNIRAPVGIPQKLIKLKKIFTFHYLPQNEPQTT